MERILFTKLVKNRTSLKIKINSRNFITDKWEQTGPKVSKHKVVCYESWLIAIPIISCHKSLVTTFLKVGIWEFQQYFDTASIFISLLVLL